MARQRSSPPVAVGPAWTRQKHQEVQEEVADLFRAQEKAGESESMELDGDRRRSETDSTSSTALEQIEIRMSFYRYRGTSRKR
jgi:hypothetical protein